MKGSVANNDKTVNQSYINISSPFENGEFPAYYCTIGK
jgi:hypothetical protein